HVLRAKAGTGLFGVAPAPPAAGLGLLAVGTAGTRLERVPPAVLADPAHAADIARLVEGWVGGLSSGLTSQTPPAGVALITAGATATVAADIAVGAGAGVVWIKPAGANVAFLGDATATLTPGETWSPLTPRTWVVARGAGSLEAIDTATAQERGALEP